MAGLGTVLITKTFVPAYRHGLARLTWYDIITNIQKRFLGNNHNPHRALININHKINHKIGNLILLSQRFQY
jgi:hypothetical protein